MNIYRLRYFAAVVETRSLRQASELVGIAPPSMSKAISVLEGELGYKLIHQEGRGIGITPKGLEIYKRSLPLLEEQRRFRLFLDNKEPVSERLKIATFEVFSSYFMSNFLGKEPQYDALILEMTPGKIEQAILNNTVEVGLTYIPSPNPALDYLEIGSFAMKVFGQKKWENKDFSLWPFAIPTTELKIYSSEIDALDMWPKSAPKRFVKYQFELLETALQTSSLGSSVLHCPDFIVKLYNDQVKSSLQLKGLKMPKRYKSSKPTKIYLVCRKGSCPPSLEGKLAKFMRSLN